MGGSKVTSMFLICLLFMLISLPPIYASGTCPPTPYPPYHRPQPPSRHPHPRPHPPHHGGRPKGPPPSLKPPGVLPPIISPPVITPPVIPPPIINPPVIPPPIISPPVITPPPSGGGGYPPYTPPPSRGGGGGVRPPPPPPSRGGGGGVPGVRPPPPPTTCPINALKLGLCLDVLGGLVHIGIGNPVENVCCPVLKGLLELEAAICLCTAIRLKLLSLNIFLPLALQVLATCGLTPPPGFVCPPLV